MDESFLSFGSQLENLPCNDNESDLDCNIWSLMESQIRNLNNAINANDFDGPCSNHNHDHFSCENSLLHKILLGYCFPLVFIMCLVGNGANILTYRGKCLRKSTTIKMLTAKAIMNTMFMICLIPHFYILTFGGIDNLSFFENYLWVTYPYMLFLANIAGTCATW